ncbi:DUF892 family protein [Sphingomonas sp.]|uniref:DUF892 family protein n=1 Tax=Sphingomonas sp. TaxID=28214 RepID=UPI002E37351E|nr:DUF892 family protein [Sphingomonas sp.]HEX4694157.1 DUF892 family protein [Sphingomonas sp.]
MTQINTGRELLEAALQDLNAGAEALASRLPAIAGHLTDDSLRAAFDDLVDRARQDVDRLRDTGMAAGGPENLWMAGVLDDAERDTQATAPGGLLDTALIGAIRKGLASTIVSHDTALALARTTGEQQAEAAVGDCRDAAVRIDHDLAGHLARIAGDLG